MLDTCEYADSIQFTLPVRRIIDHSSAGGWLEIYIGVLGRHLGCAEGPGRRTIDQSSRG